MFVKIFQYFKYTRDFLKSDHILINFLLHLFLTTTLAYSMSYLEIHKIFSHFMFASIFRIKTVTTVWMPTNTAWIKYANLVGLWRTYILYRQGSYLKYRLLDFLSTDRMLEVPSSLTMLRIVIFWVMQVMNDIFMIILIIGQIGIYFVKSLKNSRPNSYATYCNSCLWDSSRTHLFTID